MADVIDYKIIGEDLQAVEITLDPGETVRAEPGSMAYMDMHIEMQTNLEGGIFAGLKRAVAGETLFITNFLNQGQTKQSITFAAPYPGKIIPIQLENYGGKLICQKESYLCSAYGIDVDIEFNKKLGAGLFGGEGFILQKLTGDGLAFIHAGGTIVERELAEGEQIKVDTGCIVGFTQTVDYDIKFVGGFKNTLFGGEGLFLAVLTGPGKVFVQTQPFARLADRINATNRFSGDSGESGLGQMLGGLVSGR